LGADDSILKPHAHHSDAYGLVLQRWDFLEVHFVEGHIDAVGVVIKLDE
jgi:hypothetical protein